MPTRILIADDNALVRAALRRVLENSDDWQVIEATNGKEAIEKSLESRPHLIILDLAMPLMDGFRSARELRNLQPEIPILIHTLYWSPRVEIQALQLGVKKVVPKSESNSLISAVRELLASSGSTAPESTPDLQTSSLPSPNPPKNFSPKTVILKVASSKADKAKVNPAIDDAGNQQAS